MKNHRLKLIKRLNKKNSSGTYFGLFQCFCGNKKEIVISKVKCGWTKSCGCVHKSRWRNLVTKHGLCGTTEYMSWTAMRERCTNPNGFNYKNYGARGINICKRWNKFENFYKDMGKRPSKKHSIDRINNDGNYEPQNCRWATKKIQGQNTRGNKLSIEIVKHIKKLKEDGFTYQEIAKKYSVCKETIARAFLGKTWGVL